MTLIHIVCAVFLFFQWNQADVVHVYPNELILPTEEKTIVRSEITYKKRFYNKQKLNGKNVTCEFTFVIPISGEKIIFWRLTNNKQLPKFTKFPTNDEVHGGFGKVFNKIHNNKETFDLVITSTLQFNSQAIHYDNLFDPNFSFLQCILLSKDRSFNEPVEVGHISIAAAPIILEYKMNLFLHLHEADQVELNCFLHRNDHDNNNNNYNYPKNRGEMTKISWNSNTILPFQPYFHSKLTISSVNYRLHDFALFWCHAQNKYGEDSTVVIMRVRPWGMSYIALLSILILLLILFAFIQRDRNKRLLQKSMIKQYWKQFPQSVIATDGKPMEPEYRQQFV